MLDKRATFLIVAFEQAGEENEQTRLSYCHPEMVLHHAFLAFISASFLFSAPPLP